MNTYFYVYDAASGDELGRFSRKTYALEYIRFLEEADLRVGIYEPDCYYIWEG